MASSKHTPLLSNIFPSKLWNLMAACFSAYSQETSFNVYLRMWILTVFSWLFVVPIFNMFTFMNPVENYIKEIRVPCKLEPSERATTTLPFVFESQPSSRVHSAHSTEMMSSSSTFLHSFARRQDIPAVKKQLHREIVYFFGCNKEVCACMHISFSN